MKAIETTYKGYKFRSRLEARWAVFFDTIGLDWAYEIEGFILSNGERYLPDFRIKIDGWTHWIEIKPKEGGTDSKMELFEKELNIQNNMWGWTYYGDPFEYIQAGKVLCPRCGIFTMNSSDYDRPSSLMNEHGFMCQPCDFTTPCGGYHPEEKGLLCIGHPHKGTWYVTHKEYDNYQSKLNHSIYEARSARFEFLEKY